MGNAKRIITVLTACLFVPLSAFAQSPTQPQPQNAFTPTVSATAFGEWEKTETVEVRTGRDLELERDLIAEVGRLLGAAGYTVVPKGQIVLTVSSTSPVPGIEARDAYTIDDRIRTMDMTRNDRAVLVPYDVRKDEPGASVFVVRMSAYRPGQSNLWVAEASAPDNGSGRRSTSMLLAKALIGAVGQSVKPAQPSQPSQSSGAGVPRVPGAPGGK